MSDEVNAGVNLREWLRSERRLGIRHWDVGDARPVSEPAAVSVPRSSPPVAARPAPLPAAARSAPAQRPGPAITPASNPSANIELPQFCDAELSVEEARTYFERLDREHVKGCTRCVLHKQGRKQTVFGVGHVRPDIVFVGEGPGQEEDIQGEPFVGRAGELLTRMIAAMTLTRDQVYICNVVKCRPPNNRTPTEDEMAACSPFLFRQLSVLRPKVIVALGRPASQTLLATTETIGRLRGRFHDFPTIAHQHMNLPATKVMPTYHPAYLLRSPGEKVKVWDDLQEVMRFLSIPIPPRRTSGAA